MSKCEVFSGPYFPVFELNTKIYSEKNSVLDTFHTQIVNVNSTFSYWKAILTGVPQGSILNPLLFNIFLKDLFLFVTHYHLSNYADNNTLYIPKRPGGVLKKSCSENMQQIYRRICCIFSEHLFLRTPLDGCFFF